MSFLNRKLRQYYGYKQYRKKVRDYHGNKCGVCNAIDKPLLIHHKIPLRDIKILYSLNNYNKIEKCKILWDVNWQILLCKDCNIEVEKEPKNWNYSIYKEYQFNLKNE